ncbi:MAG: glycerol-3-phosphate 1-O-acyltransferase PlsY [Phycisphaerales bacterium]
MVWGTVFIAASFLSGSIPFSLLVGLAKGVDIRKVGSGNPGATNLGRALGKRWFFVGFLLDMLKGLVPVLLAGFFMNTLGHWHTPVERTWIVIACVVAAVLGHIFTPWLKFKGGKGVATTFGALLGVFPILTYAGLGALAIFLIAFAIWRRISVGSILAALCVPGIVLLLAKYAPNSGVQTEGLLSGSTAIYFWVTTALAALVILKHRTNIKRLLNGTEPRYDSKDVAKQSAAQ